jgi:hypothetical protein
VGADVGGYVPGLRNKLFFFGSFNPTVRREIRDRRAQQMRLTSRPETSASSTPVSFSSG